MRSSWLPLDAVSSVDGERLARHRIVADRQRAVGLDGEEHRLVGALLLLRGRGRQIDRHVHGRERRRDHEDDQQHQDHVDERRDVDLVGFREIVAVVSETDGHGATPPPRATCGDDTRSQSRLNSRITSAEPSASSAR